MKSDKLDYYVNSYKILSQLEFCFNTRTVCPVCYNYKHKHIGHTTDCILAKCLNDCEKFDKNIALLKIIITENEQTRLL